MWKPLPSRHVLKTVRLTAIRNELKWTISASGGLGLLQKASKLDTERCTSEDAGPQEGWIVRSHIGWRGERNILYKGVEWKTLPSRRVLKIVRLMTIRNGLKRTISASGEIGLLHLPRRRRRQGGRIFKKRLFLWSHHGVILFAITPYIQLKSVFLNLGL